MGIKSKEGKGMSHSDRIIDDPKDTDLWLMLESGGDFPNSEGMIRIIDAEGYVFTVARPKVAKWLVETLNPILDKLIP